jgi:hypothetical protein
LRPHSNLIWSAILGLGIIGFGCAAAIALMAQA